MVNEIKGENLWTGILYFLAFFYKMTMAGKAVEFLPWERMIVWQLKLVGEKFPTIRKKLMKREDGPLQVCHESHGQKMSPVS